RVAAGDVSSGPTRDDAGHDAGTDGVDCGSRADDACRRIDPRAGQCPDRDDAGGAAACSALRRGSDGGNAGRRASDRRPRRDRASTRACAGGRVRGLRYNRLGRCARRTGTASPLGRRGDSNQRPCSCSPSRRGRCGRPGDPRIHRTSCRDAESQLGLGYGPARNDQGTSPARPRFTRRRPRRSPRNEPCGRSRSRTSGDGDPKRSAHWSSPAREAARVGRGSAFRGGGLATSTRRSCVATARTRPLPARSRSPAGAVRGAPPSASGGRPRFADGSEAPAYH
ncbi:MAG: hypothetical protein QOE95_1544, partial [Gaiellaceae bacterium]|nr:hypothetical protein [Gaiellaceae bacterium]